jgi:RNA polymerase sigma factor (sigma-70 family)
VARIRGPEELTSIAYEAVIKAVEGWDEAYWHPAVYIGKIVRRDVRDQLNRDRNDMRPAISEPMAKPMEPLADVVDELELALASLDSRTRSVLWLRDGRGLTFREIGQRLNVSHVTAMAIYRYARNRLPKPPRESS